MLTVAALYRFARFDDPAALRPPLLNLCLAQSVKGTLLLAREGINGTIAGSADAIDAVLCHIRQLPDCADTDVKFSTAPVMPFHRMKVRLKREIVTMGQPDIDPLTGTGTYVAPVDWNALIAAPDTVVIDTRNDYEVKVGSFAGAIDPKTASFSDFPAWFEVHRQDLAGKRIAMFCTGGIRCEKATAFVKAQGIEDVFHLKGGILKYLEEVPADESRWQGECFVFDERVAVGQGLAPGTHALCRACRMPVSAADRQSPVFEEGVSCPACHATRDQAKRAGYAERQRQVQLALARGAAHVGAQYPPRDVA
ncbi:MAG: rhodanese-related sulfurtransferase [Sphingomonas sp.]|nr:rhodanese-related sulfurtransferase [Sphingomonas sp.]